MVNIIDSVKRIIDENNFGSTLFVFQGISPEVCGYNKVEMEKVVNDPFGIVMTLYAEKEKPVVISFDEFVCLFDVVKSAFKNIIVIKNPLYMNLYPVEIQLSDEVKDSLLAHYDDDTEESVEMVDIDKYTEIYSNFIRTETGVACCFNIEESELEREGIKIISIIDTAKEELNSAEAGVIYEQYNICNDSDYYDLTNILAFTDNCYMVNYNSYAGGTDTMHDMLARLNACYNGRLAVCVDNNSSLSERHSYPEIKEIMKQYWGYSEYRNIRMYDIDAVNRGEKKVKTVSQESIVSDIVEQVERCRAGQSARDIFVTAPTGAGKSLMFQLPAMYIAEKYGLLTIVITPLIGLMNDQVKALNGKGYDAARTINSDISPIVKNEILEDVAAGRCNILYLSPESLLSRSDITQLIGSRRIGLLVVDEAHIVTTWGKQFRPDYWYLGDYVNKLRKTQGKAEKDPMSFVIATFTATAIYKGKEDMYNETLNSLNMVDPVTYLGYIKRDNISIEVSEVEPKRNRTEYELDKFDSLLKIMNRSVMHAEKMLIYFPTVALINRFYEYCLTKPIYAYVARYHGQMDPDNKDESFRAFNDGRKMVMLATKAFGMGIDIPDIAVVAHFAPTGNVCDYMQEIGRAARDTNVQGHAIYEHMSNDFKHINHLHGLSSIYKWQLVEVIKKILELYESYRYNNNGNGGPSFTKKRNEMLIDTESFAYIFGGNTSDENNLINKVKTAMLLIQKDYENKGFTPFRIRPIPLFADGYMSMKPDVYARMIKEYPGCAELKNESHNVYKVALRHIWERKYQSSMSFPKFKYMLYSGSDELDFNEKYSFVTAMSIDVTTESNWESEYHKIIQGLKDAVNESVRNNVYLSEEKMIETLIKSSGIRKYKAENIVKVFLAAMNTYAEKYSRGINAKIVSKNKSRNGNITYMFKSSSRNFFSWINDGFRLIEEEARDGCMYVTNEKRKDRTKEMLTVLGVLESFGILRFKSLGGTNSQIYIYVNETKTMRIVRERPEFYKNRLLETVAERHTESVKMLKYLFTNGFDSDKIWNILEDYFLGIPVDIGEK